MEHLCSAHTAGVLLLSHTFSLETFSEYLPGSDLHFVLKAAVIACKELSKMHLYFVTDHFGGHDVASVQSLGMCLCVCLSIKAVKFWN